MSEALVAAPQAGGASSVAPLYKRIPYQAARLTPLAGEDLTV
jgi:hypothetical protein